MTVSLNRSVLVLTCLTPFMTAPSLASGQTASERWPGLSSSDLQTVYLLDRSGTEVSGKLLGLDPDSLLLLIDGTERRFDRLDVTRIQKRDSLKNGTLIGAGIGIVMGLIAAGISDCPGDDPGGTCGGVRAAGFLTSVGIYTGIGAGVDALIRGRTTIYAAPTSLPAKAAASAWSAHPALHIGVSW